MANNQKNYCTAIDYEQRRQLEWRIKVDSSVPRTIIISN